MLYIDVFVVVVFIENKVLYIEYVKFVGDIFKEYGVIKIFEVWGDDVFEGEVMFFLMVVKVKENEIVVFFIVFWFLKEVWDIVWKKVMEDFRM